MNGPSRESDTGPTSSEGNSDATAPSEAVRQHVPAAVRPALWLRVACWAGAFAGGTALAILVIVLPFRWINPPTTSFIVLYGGDDVQHEWVAWGQISSAVPIAAVASEDQRFPSHFGIDVQAVREVLSGGETRGASTITQQVVKNLYLWKGRSWFRKGIEAVLTVAVELLWPKRRILEVYLNVVELGPGVFGVGAAARIYFHKRPDQLTEMDASLMVVALPNPSRLSLSRPSSDMKARARWVRRQMSQLGGAAYLAEL